MCVVGAGLPRSRHWSAPDRLAILAEVQDDGGTLATKSGEDDDDQEVTFGSNEAWWCLDPAPGVSGERTRSTGQPGFRVFQREESMAAAAAASRTRRRCPRSSSSSSMSFSRSVGVFKRCPSDSGPPVPTAGDDGPAAHYREGLVPEGPVAGTDLDGMDPILCGSSLRPFEDGPRRLDSAGSGSSRLRTSTTTMTNHFNLDEVGHLESVADEVAEPSPPLLTCHHLGRHRHRLDHHHSKWKLPTGPSDLFHEVALSGEVVAQDSDIKLDGSGVSSWRGCRSTFCGTLRPETNADRASTPMAAGKGSLRSADMSSTTTATHAVPEGPTGSSLGPAASSRRPETVPALQNPTRGRIGGSSSSSSTAVKNGDCESIRWRKSKVRRRESSSSSVSPSFVFNLIFVSLFALSALATDPDKHICKSKNLRSATQLRRELQGCIVIEGHLVISSLYSDPDVNYIANNNISFPELREITDYVLLYQNPQIISLQQLFPNLVVIRGNHLIKDFALVIYLMPNMVEVGLTGLTHILHGGVRIRKNPKLCYVQTIDWKRIVSKPYHGMIMISDNEDDNKCPNICPGTCKYCWNEKNCLRVRSDCPQMSEEDKNCYTLGTPNGQMMTCSRECLGGCYDDTQGSCFSCANAHWQFSKKNNGGRDCRTSCPEPYLMYQNWRCISIEQCLSTNYYYNVESINEVGFYKAYNGKCLRECPPNTKETEGGKSCEKCPNNNCPKECYTEVISSLSELSKFGGCTKVNGDLTIQISGENVVQSLEKYLGSVKVITGALKISRSFPIISLDFFKSLEEIQGITLEGEKKATLVIEENENLHKLFPIHTLPSSNVTTTVQIRTRSSKSGAPQPGRASIHYNPKLCKQEITRLIQLSGLHDPGLSSPDISYATNGGQAVCSSNKLNLTATANGANSIALRFSNYHEKIMEADPTNDYRVLIKYEIHYREVSEAVFNARNVTKYEGRDACGGDDWTIIDHLPTDPGEFTNVTNIWPSEGTLLSGKPYTHYAIFVSTKILREGLGNPDGGGSSSRGVEGAQSDVVYVLTEESIPSVPRDIRVNNLNSTAINITWLSPSQPNGIVDHYELFLEFHAFDPKRVENRPFCAEGFRIKPNKEDPVESGDFSAGVGGNSSSTSSSSAAAAANGVCDCQKVCGVGSGGPSVSSISKNQVSKTDKLEEDDFQSKMIDTIFPSPGNKNIRIPPPDPAVDLLTERRRKRSLNGVGNGSGNDISAASQEGSSAVDKGLLEAEDPYLQGQQQQQEQPQVQPYASSSMLDFEMPSSKLDEVGGELVYTLFAAKVQSQVRSEGRPWTRHHVVVSNLKHFSTYNLKLKACHRSPPAANPGPKLDGDDGGEENGSSDHNLLLDSMALLGKRCSLDYSETIQTAHKPGADDIEGNIRVVGGIVSPTTTTASKSFEEGLEDRGSVNDTSEPPELTEPNGSSSSSSSGGNEHKVWLTWDPPKDPNTLIVNYNIRITMDKSGAQQQQAISNCITAKQFEENGRRYPLTVPGSYFVSVQAVSVYGPGNWTAYEFVKVVDSNTTMLVTVIVPSAVFFLLIISLAVFFYHKSYMAKGPAITPNIIYHNIDEVYIVDEWEIEREKVELGKQLGGGAFGVVFAGKYDDVKLGKIDVAVKTVKDSQLCRNLLSEAQVMKRVKSAHVVKLIGVVSQGAPPYVLLEMMHNGSLKEYLHSLRGSKKQPERRPSEKEFLQMALEIADGMGYLSTIKDPNPIVHCDLAARNCLVGDPVVIKIGDFGMAHEVYTDYYRKGTPGMMPVRWMAPESLRDGKFSSASDVWSFGVVLWEMVTLAEQPYQGMGNEGVARYINNGGTMERPNACPDHIHNLMRECWRQDPEDRPTFIDICQKLLPIATDRFLRESFITSPEGKAAILEQQTAREESSQQYDAVNEKTKLTAGISSAFAFGGSSNENSSSNGNGNVKPSSSGGGGGDRTPLLQHNNLSLKLLDNGGIGTTSTSSVRFANPLVEVSVEAKELNSMEPTLASSTGDVGGTMISLAPLSNQQLTPPLAVPDDEVEQPLVAGVNNNVDEAAGGVPGGPRGDRNFMGSRMIDRMPLLNRLRRRTYFEGGGATGNGP